MKLTVSEIAMAVGAPGFGGAQDEVVATGVTWDSRAVTPGDLYVALPGERVDGHDYIEAAIDSGAVAVLASREVNASVPVIVVDDTSQAFTRLGAYWRGRLSGTVIGLTGSSGKTTTKNLVRDVLAHDLSVVATKANQNNELGVPRTLLAAESDTQAIVVEMGMRGRGQIAELAEVARPDWGVITNVGTSHIELLGSREEIARAKAELFEALPDSCGVAFLNAGDDFARLMYEHARMGERGITVVLYGIDLGGVAADGGSGSAGHGSPVFLQAMTEALAACPLVWASDVVIDDEGCPAFTMSAVGFEQIGLEDANGVQHCTLQLRGLHNVENACAAAAVGLANGMTLSACCEALAAARPEQGRQQVHHCPNGVTVVDDAYNANPDSMAASLATFTAMHVTGRRIAVLGDMLELGDYARASHEGVGELAAASGLDKLVCVGDLSRSIASAAVSAGMDEGMVTVCDTADEAYDAIAGDLAKGDAVLVKASHSIGLDSVVERLVM